jgi:fucose 4-O-acetylase-like acetyltransferase
MTSATETLTPSATPASSPRIAYLDNARFWAMVLVVIGHPMLYFVTLQSGRSIYYWIYLVHMPLFTLLSGYMSRNFRATPDQIQRTISTLVVPYLIIEPIYQVIHRHHSGTPDPYRLLSPQWIAWFLAALLVWRLSTPIWRNLRHPIVVAVIISLLAPLTEVPNVISMPKVLGLLPFYVVGMYMTMDKFERLAAVRVRIAGLAFLAAVGLACALYSDHWLIGWTKWRDRYDEEPLSASPLEGIAVRGLVLLVGMLMCFAILSLIPWAKSWTSDLGGRTIYCYLLHGFVVLFLALETSAFVYLLDLGPVGVVITIAGASLAAVLLMTRPIELAFRFAFEPKLDWLFSPRQSLPK